MSPPAKIRLCLFEDTRFVLSATYIFGLLSPSLHYGNKPKLISSLKQRYWFSVSLVAAEILKSLSSRSFAILTLVMTSGCKTGYRSLRIFISFVKLTVVINITEQLNIRSLNGSCASNSLTLVFLNFLRFYLPRSFESLYVSFPVLLKFILGLACGN